MEMEDHLNLVTGRYKRLKYALVVIFIVCAGGYKILDFIITKTKENSCTSNLWQLILQVEWLSQHNYELPESIDQLNKTMVEPSSSLYLLHCPSDKSGIANDSSCSSYGYFKSHVGKGQTNTVVMFCMKHVRDTGKVTIVSYSSNVVLRFVDIGDYVQAIRCVSQK